MHVKKIGKLLDDLRSMVFGGGLCKPIGKHWIQRAKSMFCCPLHNYKVLSNEQKRKETVHEAIVKLRLGALIPRSVGLYKKPLLKAI